MNKYSYTITSGNTKRTFKIAAPSSLMILYRVTSDGEVIGALLRDKDTEGYTVWQCTTSVLLPYKDELGNYIDANGL